MELHGFLVIVHMIGSVLGVGGATASDFTFLRSIKDRRLGADEFNILKTLSRLLWTGLILLIISGIGFLINQYVQAGQIHLLSDPRFLAKMTIVFVILANGIVFHTLVIPYLKKQIGKEFSLKKFGAKFYLISTTGAISIISWYSTFLLGILRSIELPYLILIKTYIILVLFGILVSFAMLYYKTTHKTNY